MACERRQRTGTCGHTQCPFPDETEHGYHCVQIELKDEHYPANAPEIACEVGENCIEKCPHSWRKEG